MGIRQSRRGVAAFATLGFALAGCLTKPNPDHADESSGGMTDSASTQTGASTGVSSLTGAATGGSGSSPTSSDSASTTESNTNGTGPSDASWWDENYRFRRVVRVTATAQAAVPSEASVWFAFDTASEISAASLLSDGTDFRVVRCDADDACTEIDRWVDGWEGDGWNSADTRVWITLGETVPAGETDDRTLVYWGNPAPADAPADDLEAVFLFADDFESDLSRWLLNGPADAVTIQSAVRGSGTGSLRLDAGTAGIRGLHKDIDLPLLPLHVSALINKEDFVASFGIVRLFSVPYAERVPGWIEDAVQVHCELNSDGCLMLVTYVPYQDHCFANLAPNIWAKVAVASDPVEGVTYGILEDAPISGPFAPFYDNTAATRSVALEGEGQGGVFYVDDYIVRVHLDPWPDVVLGAVEPLM